MKRITTHFFSTGVKRNWLRADQLPSLAVWDGNNVMAFPFQCEDVPPKSGLMFLCDDPAMRESWEGDVIVREILPGSGLMSKYAYFRTYGNSH